MKETPSDPAVSSWFTGRLPESWFSAPPEVRQDTDEIIVVGSLPDDPAIADEVGREARATRFREETREERMKIAGEAERRFRRHVSWGVKIGTDTYAFTTHSSPVMTRLRQPERIVLDTLVASGVARSRSEALAWCVRLVAQHQGDWITELEGALGAVRAARAKGPEV